MDNIFEELVIKALLFDNHPKPVWVKLYDSETDTFHMCFVNKAYTEKYGKTQEEYQGKQDFEVWAKRIGEDFNKRDRAALKDGFAMKEFNGVKIAKWRIKDDINKKIYIAGGEL